jgi:hypothetical protein
MWWPGHWAGIDTPSTCSFTPPADPLKKSWRSQSGRASFEGSQPQDLLHKPPDSRIFDLSQCDQPVLPGVRQGNDSVGHLLRPLLLKGVPLQGGGAVVPILRAVLGQTSTL